MTDPLDALDELGARAATENAPEPPGRPWLEARVTARRRRRRLTAAAAALAVVGGGLFALAAVRAPEAQLTEAVDATTPEADAEPTPEPPEPADTTGDDEPAPPPATAPTTDPSLCGAWPSGFEIWPDRASDEPVDTIDDDGRLLRRQSADGYTLEIVWPPVPQVDYDLDYEPTPSTTLWSTEVGATTLLGFDPGQAREGASRDEPTVEDQALAVLRISADDPALDDLDDLEADCASVELRLLDGEELVERVGVGLGSLGDDIVITDDSGQSFTFTGGIEWLELGPIVVEQREVGAVPGSVTCDGVLVDVDTTTYRIDEQAPESATLADAVAAGWFVEIADPLTETTTADPAEIWAVVLPNAPAGATLGELGQQGLLTYIDAGLYEDFVDPETGPTAGPGIVGSFDRPIDALRAFFDNPVAETFIKAGLVELIVDESTYAYGVPQGHGEGGWVTVITVENEGDGWLVTGWTSAGC